MPIESLTSHRHLKLIERILHNIIRIQLINLIHNRFHTPRNRIREKQELGPRQGLETSQSKLVRLELFETRDRDTGDWVAVSRCGGGICARGGGNGGSGGLERNFRGNRAGDCMDAAKLQLILFWDDM